MHWGAMNDALPKQAILIVNAMSRRGCDVFDEARAKLELAGVELIDAIAIDRPEEMDKTTLVQNLKDWTQIISQFGLGAAAIKVLGN